MAVSSTFVAADGDGYELQMGRWSRRLAPLFIDFAGLGQRQRVLDVGCGTGNLSVALARTPRLAACVASTFPRCMSSMRERKIRDAGSISRWVMLAHCRFPTPRSTTPLSMLVLQFIPQPDLAVREMRRVTRPGGTVAAATWDTRGGFVAYRMIFDTAAMLDRSGSERRAKAYTRPISRPGELAQAWRGAGLIDVVQLYAHNPHGLRILRGFLGAG